MVRRRQGVKEVQDSCRGAACGRRGARERTGHAPGRTAEAALPGAPRSRILAQPEALSVAARRRPGGNLPIGTTALNRARRDRFSVYCGRFSKLASYAHRPPAPHARVRWERGFAMRPRIHNCGHLACHPCTSEMPANSSSGGDDGDAAHVAGHGERTLNHQTLARGRVRARCSEEVIKRCEQRAPRRLHLPLARQTEFQPNLLCRRFPLGLYGNVAQLVASEVAPRLQAKRLCETTPTHAALHGSPT
jgi:hypothetical protein